MYLKTNGKESVEWIMERLEWGHWWKCEESRLILPLYKIMDGREQHTLNLQNVVKLQVHLEKAKVERQYKSLWIK